MALFIQFLKLILKEYPNAKKIYAVVDNAPWHRAEKVEKFLRSIGNKIELIRIPPYSPDLNPIETLWRAVKKDVVYNTFYPLFKGFKGALRHSLRNFDKGRVKSICNFKKYGIKVV
ncbi:MAG: transposase [Promethearchaeota archaeon]